MFLYLSLIVLPLFCLTELGLFASISFIRIGHGKVREDAKQEAFLPRRKKKGGKREIRIERRKRKETMNGGKKKQEKCGWREKEEERRMTR